MFKISICIICGAKIRNPRFAPKPRETCNRVKVGDTFIKSNCEKEKDRRFQVNYRRMQKEKKENVPVEQAPSRKHYSGHHRSKFNKDKVSRECLKCGKDFIGVGLYNRICEKCTCDNNNLKFM